jgi:hypothetical protein
MIELKFRKLRSQLIRMNQCIINVSILKFELCFILKSQSLDCWIEVMRYLEILIFIQTNSIELAQIVLILNWLGLKNSNFPSPIWVFWAMIFIRCGGRGETMNPLGWGTSPQNFKISFKFLYFQRDELDLQN